MSILGQKEETLDDILRLIASLLLANQIRESRGSMTCVVDFSDRETPDKKRKQKKPHEIILEACHVVRKRIELFSLTCFHIRSFKRPHM